jgi:hypothetical protein
MLRGSNVRPDRVKIAIVLLWVVIMANGIEAQELANYRELLADYDPGLTAIATIVVLCLVKIGLNVFCECTEPTQ